MYVGKALLRGVDAALIRYPGLAFKSDLVPKVLLSYGIACPVGDKSLYGLVSGIDAYAVSAYVRGQGLAQIGIDGINEFVTEQLIAEVLVQVDVYTAAVAVYVGMLNLEILEVDIRLILLKVLPDFCAYSGIVRLSLEARNGQYDGQCRH